MPLRKNIPVPKRIQLERAIASLENQLRTNLTPYARKHKAKALAEFKVELEKFEKSRSVG